MSTRRRKRVRLWPGGPFSLLAASAILALWAGWLAFAPVGLGGSLYYLETEGPSMLPLFHPGDLAIVRRGGPYRIGEIVLYRYPKLGVFLHRIVGVSGGRFLMKGDHNAYIDPYHPLPSDVLGHLWFHVRGAGVVLSWFHDPSITVGIAVAVGAGLLVMPYLFKDPRKEDASRRRRIKRPLPLLLLGPTGVVVATVVLVVLLASGVFAVFAFSARSTSVKAIPERFTQSGSFSYSATGPASVYPGGRVSNGEPVFQKIIPSVNFRFAYHLAAPQAASITGTISLRAILSEPDGWSDTLVLAPPTHFSGDRGVVAGMVSLSQVDGVLSSLGQAIGVSGTPGANLSIVPRVAVAGKLAGSKFSQSFSPALPFTVDSVEISLGQSSQTGTATAANFNPASTGVVYAYTSVPARIGTLGVHVTVAAGRHLAVAGGVVGFLLALVLAAMYRLANTEPEAERILSRYRSVLVEAKGSGIDSLKSPVAVASMEELVRLANQEGMPVLHWVDSEGTHRFVVMAYGIGYLYTCGGAPAIEEVAQDSQSQLAEN